MALHIQTPLLQSRPLSLLTGRSVWLKMEALQPAGSFKIRGIGLACAEYQRRGAQRFIASSAGNAGLAVAYAGRCLDVPVTVVVPETTSQNARDLLAQENAQVIVHGDSWQEANAHAQAMLEETDAFLHPFDDPLLWRGHATLVDELAQAGFRPDAIMLAVGGGGLLAGVVEGLRRHGWTNIPVITVETQGTHSLHASLEAGERITLERITSIAASLGAKQVSEQAFQLAREHPLHSLLVSDREAVQACSRFLDDHRVLVEPACGAALAPVYRNDAVLEDFDQVLVIVCGGVNVSASQLQDWQQEYGDG